MSRSDILPSLIGLMEDYKTSIVYTDKNREVHKRVIKEVIEDYKPDLTFNEYEKVQEAYKELEKVMDSPKEN